MKTTSPSQNRKNGFMVIGVIIILGLMSVYVATNVKNLAHLKRELQLIEQKQIQHWRFSWDSTQRRQDAKAQSRGTEFGK